MNLVDVIAYWRIARPAATAVVCGTERLTWAQLDQRASAAAAGLQKAGICQGDRVAILAINRIDWCVMTIAILKAGAFIVPLNDRLAPREIKEILTDAEVSAVATDAILGPKLAEARAELSFTVIDFDASPECSEAVSFAALAQTADELQPVDIQGHDIAIIAYTSGTTGLPKGVMLTHGNVLAQAFDRNVVYGWSPDTLRTLLCVPLSVTGGIVTNFLLTYIAGGCIYLEADYNAERILNLIVTERITCMMGASIMWELLTKVDGFDSADLSSLTTALGGGQPAPPFDLFAHKGVQFHQVYGCTEAAAMVTDLPPHRLPDKPRSIGMPSMHTQVRVVDDHGADVKAGDVGELWVCGPTVMKGYWRNPAATAEAISGGWLRTGDLVVQDEDGLLEWIDRKKDMYRSGGFNVYPAEVERVLATLPGVIECAVVMVSDSRWDQVGAAIIRASIAIDPADVVTFCKARLATYKVPRYVVMRAEPLPRNASGKILRRVLQPEYERLPKTQHALI
jgi:fatty-acyl-CoA synthase